MQDVNLSILLYRSDIDHPHFDMSVKEGIEGNETPLCAISVLRKYSYTEADWKQGGVVSWRLARLVMIPIPYPRAKRSDSAAYQREDTW